MKYVKELKQKSSTLHPTEQLEPTNGYHQQVLWWPQMTGQTITRNTNNMIEKQNLELTCMISHIDIAHGRRI